MVETLTPAYDRPDAPNVFVIITDAEPNVDTHLTIPEARTAKQLGVDVFVISLGNKTGMDELLGMASSPSYWFLEILDYIQLNSALFRIMDKICGGETVIVTLV